MTLLSAIENDLFRTAREFRRQERHVYLMKKIDVDAPLRNEEAADYFEDRLRTLTGIRARLRDGAVREEWEAKRCRDS